MGNKNDKAYCTIAIAAANVIVFLYLSFGGMTESGEYMLAHGAMYVPYILENGEYYRLLTSIFLHFGFQHLFNNMVMLLMIGWNLELEMGRVRYVITYFVSGLAGNILSGFLDIRAAGFCNIRRSLRSYFRNHRGASVCSCLQPRAAAGHLRPGDVCYDRDQSVFWLFQYRCG